MIRLPTAAKQKDQQTRFSRLMAAGKDNHGDGTDANRLLKAALEQARASKRGVFVMFPASWCGPCFALHHFLQEPEIKPIIDRHFVFQEIEVWENIGHIAWDNPGGEALYEKYGEIDGVPFWVALGPDGNVGGTGEHGNAANMGSPNRPDEVAWFLRSLKAAAPSLADAAVAVFKQ